MNVYRLFGLLLRAIVTGHGKSPIYFDTEGQKFNYHMARIGSAYLQDVQIGDGYWITLHEERQNG